MSVYSPYVQRESGRLSPGHSGSDPAADEPPHSAGFGDIDMGSGPTRRDVLRVLFKHKLVILSTFLTVSLLVGLGLFFLPGTYTAQAKILIRVDQQGDPTFFSGVAAVSEPRSYESSARRLETEMALLEVMPLAIDVVQRLQLRYDQVYQSPRRFFTAPIIGAVDRLRAQLFGTPIKDRRGLAATIGAFRGSIAVRPATPKSSESMSNIVIVTLRSPDPLVAQRALSALLDSYMRLDAKLKEEAGTAALRIVQSESQEASSQLAAAEQRLRSFLAVRGGRSARTSPETPVTRGDGASVAQMKARLVELEIELLSARRIFRPESEQVVSLERRIADLRGRVNTDLVGDASDYSRETQLRRDVREAESRYNLLLERLEGISLFLKVSSQEIGQRVVIEPPGIPDSSDWQKRLALGIIGAVLGLFLGLVLAGVRHVVDQTVATTSDVESALGLETVGVVPLVRGLTSRSVPVVAKPNARPHELASAFRELATRVSRKFAGSDRSGRTILVTSAREGEGKTTVARGLAAELAATSGGRVLLVGARAGAELAEGGHTDNARSALDILPSLHWLSDSLPAQAASVPHGATTNGRESYTGNLELAAAFLQEARRRYSWVIVDGATVTGGATALAPLVDATLLVVEAEKTRRQVVRATLCQLGLQGDRFGGIVLNRRRYYIPRLLYDRV